MATTPAKKETPNAAPIRPTGTFELPDGEIPRSSLLFTRLHAKATLPVYSGASGAFELHICDITESGRDNRITLPAHSLSRPIPTGLSLSRGVGGRGCLLFTPYRLIREGLFIVNGPALTGPDDNGEIKIILFNTRPEAARVMHGDHIADLFRYELRNWRGAEWAQDSNGGEDDT